MMKASLTRPEQTALKFSLKQQKMVDITKLNFRDMKTGEISDKLSNYGSTINKIYPLLDPEMDKKMRTKKHITWWKSSKITNTFLTSVQEEAAEAKPEDFDSQDTEYLQSRRDMIQELTSSAPCVLKFLPSKKILHKLI